MDALLNQFFAMLAADPAALTGSSLRGLAFTRDAARAGYSQPQVDAWLGVVAEQLDTHRGTAGRAVPPSPSEDGWPSDQSRPSLPAPYEEPECGLFSGEESYPVSSLSSEIDPATDPGRNAVRELPATPPWASITVLVVLVALMGYFAVNYVR